jgi:hypothetical protein
MVERATGHQDCAKKTRFNIAKWIAGTTLSADRYFNVLVFLFASKIM